MIQMAYHHRETLLRTLALLFAALLAAGCQEDSRASRTTADRASELADSRLQQATDGLLDTLGQPRSLANSSAEAPTSLRWNAPLTREDGSALAPGQIAGFRIYYRLRHQDTFRVIEVSNPSVTRYSLASMAPGAYEFTITTVDVDGLESRRSEPVAVNLI